MSSSALNGTVRVLTNSVTLVSRAWCALSPFHLIWFTIDINVGPMMLVLSIDRLILLIAPLWHYRWVYPESGNGCMFPPVNLASDRT